ncbi:MAG: [protein-PII] uridylyltransferase, partial [Deltaproteobacteria bacterium]|nr:[protein-PII] uridylyltransferase [Deltaproteobacteria bacterium]
MSTLPHLADASRTELSDREFVEVLRNHLSVALSDALRRQREGLEGGRAACAAWSDAMDAVVGALHERARRKFLASGPNLKYRLAVVAVGGYGRRELCPRSDVDLLFLHPYKVDPYVEAMTESMLYPMWDVALDVGHGVRSVREAIRMAASDDSIRTALLDYRFVAGDPGFFAEAEKEMARFLYFADSDRFIEKKIREMEARHARFGDTVFVLEPNLKEGKGGLRDLQTALWAARIKYKCRELVELRNKGVVASQAVLAYRHAQDRLLRVRNELHILAGKKTDTLAFEFQEPMADLLGYRTHGKSFAVERFMRAYYMHALAASHITEELLEEVGKLLPESGRRPFPFLQRKTVSGEGILYKGKMYVRDSAALRREPVRILEFFRLLQRNRAELSAQAKRAIQRSLPAVGQSFREDPRVTRLFLDILRDPVHARETLTAMNESRFLGRYIPEFAPLCCKVLHDIYHVYTVDVHSIIAAGVLPGLEAAATLTAEEEEFLRIYRSLPRPDLLNLAILLHDIGKGRGHGHSRIGAEIVAQISRRMGLGPRETDDLVFLVEQHLLMANVSQRRDLHDLDLILWFTDIVGTIQRLDLLYLLTYADLRAVGPDVWTQWKAMLLAELYDKAKNILEHGRHKRPFEERALARRERARDLLAEFPPEAVSRFLDRFDDRYFLATPDARFPDHVRILSAYDGKTPRVEVIEAAGSGVSEFIIACPDRRGLFSMIAGTLSANGINILNASISTSLDGTALDTFYVTYLGKALRDDLKKERVVADLMAVLHGETGVETLLAENKVSRFVREKVVGKYRPTRVLFDNSVSTRYTVVDIFTYDRIGLLYDITRTLTALGLDIVLSKISTKADQVADVFYVVDK